MLPQNKSQGYIYSVRNLLSLVASIQKSHTWHQSFESLANWLIDDCLGNRERMKTEFSINPYHVHCAYLKDSALYIHCHNVFVKTHSWEMRTLLSLPPYTPKDVMTGTSHWEAELALVPIPLMSAVSGDAVILWRELRLQCFIFPISPTFVVALRFVDDGGKMPPSTGSLHTPW